MSGGTPRNTYARILIPVDGTVLTARAIPYARALGGRASSLVLLAVEPDPGTPPMADVDLRGFEVLERHPEARRQELETLAASPRRTDPARAIVVVRALGDPARRILEVAGGGDVELVVMAGPDRATTDLATYRRLAARVAGDAAVPVLVVPPSGSGPRDTLEPPIHRLLVPLDGSTQADRALVVAAGRAKRLGVPVHLLAAVDARQAVAPDLALDAALGGAFAAEVLGGLAYEAERVLERAQARLAGAGVAATAELRVGPAVGCIRETAMPGDVIVLSARGHGGEEATGLGSVAGALVRESPVPVLVLPPEPEPGVVAPVAEERTIREVTESRSCPGGA
jgi:nucleotide-binding universal stress UspA family protein